MSMRSMRGIWIDAGKRDDWVPRPRRRGLPAELSAVGVPDSRVYFEIFDGGHMGIDYRYPLALSWLAHRLAR